MWGEREKEREEGMKDYQTNVFDTSMAEKLFRYAQGFTSLKVEERRYEH